MDSVTRENQLLFFTLYLFLAIIGILANLLVLRTFLREKYKSYFHIQLALVNLISLMIITFIGPAALKGRFFFGDAICTYTGFHAFFFGFAEINFTCLVCIESGIAIMKKSKYRDYLTSSLKTGISIASWIYALVFAVAPLYGWGRYTYEPKSTSCGIDLTRRVPSEVPYLFVATVLFTIMILSAITAVCVAYTKKDNSYSQVFEPLIRETELVKITTALLTVLGVCSVPFAIRVVCYILGTPSPFTTSIGVEFSHLCMKASCCFHPIVYFLFSEEFRKKAAHIITGIEHIKKEH